MKPMRFACLLMTLLISEIAAAAPSVAISNFRNGDYFDNSTLGFNGARSEITIEGVVAGIDPNRIADYALYVQGLYTNLQPTGKNSLTFTKIVPIGPDAPPGSNWYPYYPYLETVRDATSILKPLIVDLFHYPTNRLVARTRIVVFDKRPQVTMEHASTRQGLDESLMVEITSTGLDRLEETHIGTLPLPSLSSFNAGLSSRFSGFQQTTEMPTDLGAQNRACVALPDTDPVFRSSAEYAQVYTEAVAAYASYQAAEEFLNTGAVSNLLAALFPPGFLATAAGTIAVQKMKDSICVQSEPQQRDFEVCYGSLDGISRNLDLRAVDSTDLEVGDSLVSQHLKAKTVLGRLDGTVNGRLNDLTIRYKENIGGIPRCTVRPSATVDNNASPAMVAATTCDGLEVDVVSSNTPDWLTYAIDHLPSNPERNRVQANTPPVPTFVLGLNRPTDPDKGACTEPAVRPYVANHLQLYWNRMRSALDATWNAGHPSTQQAVALDHLLSRWETGVFGDAALRDHTLTNTFNKPDITALPEDRLVAKLSSDVQATAPLVPTAPWLYSEPRFFPCAPGSRPCLPGQTPFGNPFDVSYTVTTGALNQVLRELSATNWMYFRFRPTYAQLGIQPKSGADMNDPAPLDAATLSQFHPAFADLGNTTVSILMRPTITPFTWIHPDPPDPPPPADPYMTGRYPLTYQLGQYEMNFVGDQPGPDGSRLWLRAVIDFHDRDFRLNLDPVPSRNLLEAQFGPTDIFRLTVVKSQLLSCGFAPKTQPPMGGGWPACGGELEYQLKGLAEGVMRDRLIGMLSRYPATQVFDAAGRTTAPKNVNQIDKYQWEQVITFYGEIEP